MDKLQVMPVYAISAEAVRGLDWTPLARHMPGRMERAGRYRFERDRLLCIGGGLLMRDVVGIRDESELRLGPCGKPFAPGYPAFNLSHSGDWCVLIKGEGDIGVDIEQTDGRSMDAAPAAFTPRELAWMEKAPLERFYRLWTWKESLLKAAGLGLSLEPSSLDVLPFAQNRPIRLNGQLWYASSGSIAGYRYSACAPTPLGPLEWIDLSQIPSSHTAHA